MYPATEGSGLSQDYLGVTLILPEELQTVNIHLQKEGSLHFNFDTVQKKVFGQPS